MAKLRHLAQSCKFFLDYTGTCEKRDTMLLISWTAKCFRLFIVCWIHFSESYIVTVWELARNLLKFALRKNRRTEAVGGRCLEH